MWYFAGQCSFPTSCYVRIIISAVWLCWIWSDVQADAAKTKHNLLGSALAELVDLLSAIVLNILLTVLGNRCWCWSYTDCCGHFSSAYLEEDRYRYMKTPSNFPKTFSVIGQLTQYLAEQSKPFSYKHVIEDTQGSIPNNKKALQWTF